MIISQGMCKGPGPWQVSGRPFLALWSPYHAQFRTRIRDDWGYAPSPSTSAPWGICQQRRQGREFGDVLQNGLSQWLGKKATVVTKICNRDSWESVCTFKFQIYYIYSCLCLDPLGTLQKWDKFPKLAMDICAKRFLGNPGLLWAVICNPGFHYCDLHCTHAMIKNTHAYRDDGHTASKNRTGSGGGTKGQISRNAALMAWMVLFMATWPIRCLRSEQPTWLLLE